MKSNTGVWLILMCLVLIACNAPSEPKVAPVIANFTATPIEIGLGESTVLSWTVTGASELTIMPGSHVVTGSGSITVSPEESVTYTLSARNAYGAVSKDVDVTVTVPDPGVAPVIASLIAVPAEIELGASVTLSWEVVGATELSITPGPHDVTGKSDLIISPEESSTYTLTARNAYGAVSKDVDVTVTVPDPGAAPIIASFIAVPAEIELGASVTLSWEVVGATELSITPGPHDVTGRTDLTISPEESTTYTLTARNPKGETATSVLVTVNGLPDAPEEARFDFSDATGLQLGSLSQSGGSAGSGLLKITESGLLVDSLSRGWLKVLDFTIRNGSVYVLLNGVANSDVLRNCVLAEVGRDGYVECVDAEVRAVDIRSIQFDARGGVYYRATTQDYVSVIRRVEGGIATTVYRAPSGTSIQAYLVTRAGTVLAQEGLTSASWGSVRAIDQAGYIRNLDLHVLLDFLPDGSVLGWYVDSWHLRRLLIHNDLEVDARAYCCSDVSSTTAPRFESSPTVPQDWELSIAVDSGQFHLYSSADDAVALLPDGLYRFYPTVERLTAPLDTYTHAEIVGGKAVVAGHDVNREPRAYAIDLITGGSQELLHGQRIEVSRLLPLPGDRRIMIFGLDLNRNQQVVGAYDFETQQFEVLDDEGRLAESFQALDWEASHVSPEMVVWQPEPRVSVSWSGGWRDGMVELDASSTPRAAFIDSFEWDFGDGTTATGMRVAHAYVSPGEYDITLTATTDLGESATVTERVRADTAAPLLQVSLGASFVVTLAASGDVYAVGSNSNGQLGDGTTSFRAVPVAAQALPPSITAIATGDNYTLVLTREGEVYGWGQNLYRALGEHSGAWNVITPTQVAGLPSHIADISAGGARSFAISAIGELYAWGRGPLGDGVHALSGTPKRIEVPAIQQVATGDDHSLALTTGGEVYVWGYGESGQLGTGDTSTRITPFRLDGLQQIKWVGAGRYFSLALTESGELYTWGANDSGQLGDGTRDQRAVPAKVGHLPAPVAAVAAGDEYVLVLLENGELYGWGLNSHGQLGLGHGAAFTIVLPTRIEVNGAVNLVAGRNTSGVITVDGALMLWGTVPGGLLGIADDWSQYTPPTRVR